MAQKTSVASVELPPPKKWYQSRTIWFAVLTVVAGIVDWIATQQAAGVAITAVGVINFALRLITAQAIKNSPADQ